MSAKNKLKPYKFTKSDTFGVSFRHPLLEGKRVTRGLGTRVKTAALRVAEGLQYLCENPQATLKEFHGRDPRAWAIFFKDVEPQGEELISLESVARETFPDLLEADLQRALRYVVSEETTNFALVEVLQHIAKISGFLEDQRAPQSISAAFKAMLETLGARIDSEVAGRKKAERGSKLDAIVPYEPDYGSNPNWDDSKLDR